MRLKFKDLPRIFPKQRLLGATYKNFTFIVTEEDKVIRASVKVVGAKPFDKTRHDLSDRDFETIDDAIRACEEFAKKPLQ